MIYFVAPDVARPSGGVRAIYRCVDLLNAAGVAAAVLHKRKHFRCRWFDNDTQIVYPPVRVGAADVLVLPAFFLADLPTIAPGVRKVVFNQNAYRTFRAAPGRSGSAARNLMRADDISGVLVVSEDNERYLELALPEVPITRLHHWIDPEVFYTDGSAPRRKIAVMPRKRRDDFEQVAAILAARQVLTGWELEALEGKTELEVAASLREAVLFVSLGKAEGFGLPAAEAMACGCQVIGYHGMGGREFFREPFAVVIEDGDNRALASAIEDFVRTYEERAGTLRRQGADASAFIHSTYSRERATADLVGFFGPLAGNEGPPAEAVVSGHDLRHESRIQRAVRRRLTPVGRRLLRATSRG